MPPKQKQKIFTPSDHILPPGSNSNQVFGTLNIIMSKVQWIQDSNPHHGQLLYRIKLWGQEADGRLVRAENSTALETTELKYYCMAPINVIHSYISDMDKLVIHLVDSEDPIHKVYGQIIIPLVRMLQHDLSKNQLFHNASGLYPIYKYIPNQQDNQEYRMGYQQIDINVAFALIVDQIEMAKKLNQNKNVEHLQHLLQKQNKKHVDPSNLVERATQFPVVSMQYANNKEQWLEQAPQVKLKHTLFAQDPFTVIAPTNNYEGNKYCDQNFIRPSDQDHNKELQVEDTDFHKQQPLKQIDNHIDKTIKHVDEQGLLGQHGQHNQFHCAHCCPSKQNNINNSPNKQPVTKSDVKKSSNSPGDGIEQPPMRYPRTHAGQYNNTPTNYRFTKHEKTQSPLPKSNYHPKKRSPQQEQQHIIKQEYQVETKQIQTEAIIEQPINIKPQQQQQQQPNQFQFSKEYENIHQLKIEVIDFHAFNDAVLMKLNAMGFKNMFIDSHYKLQNKRYFFKQQGKELYHINDNHEYQVTVNQLYFKEFQQDQLKFIIQCFRKPDNSEDGKYFKMQLGEGSFDIIKAFNAEQYYIPIHTNLPFERHSSQQQNLQFSVVNKDALQEFPNQQYRLGELRIKAQFIKKQDIPQSNIDLPFLYYYQQWNPSILIRLGTVKGIHTVHCRYKIPGTLDYFTTKEELNQLNHQIICPFNYDSFQKCQLVPLIVEVYKDNQICGIIRLSLCQIYHLVCPDNNGSNSVQIFKNDYPILLSDDFHKIQKLKDSSCVGELHVLIAFGSPSQIYKIKRQDIEQQAIEVVKPVPQVSEIQEQIIPINKVETPTKLIEQQKQSTVVVDTIGTQTFDIPNLQIKPIQEQPSPNQQSPVKEPQQSPLKPIPQSPPREVTNYYVHEFQLILKELHNLVLDIPVGTGMEIEYQYPLCQQSVKSYPLHYSKQQVYKIPSTSSYTYIQQIDQHCKFLDVVDSLEGGFQFKLKQDQQTMATTLLSSQQISNWMEQSDNFSKDKVLIFTQYNSKLHFTLNYERTQLTMDDLQQNQELLNRHNQTVQSIHLPKKVCLNIQAEVAVNEKLLKYDDKFLQVQIISVRTFTKKIPKQQGVKAIQFSEECSLDVDDDLIKQLQIQPLVIELSTLADGCRCIGRCELSQQSLLREGIDGEYALTTTNGLFAGFAKIKVKLNKYKLPIGTIPDNKSTEIQKELRVILVFKEVLINLRRLLSDQQFDDELSIYFSIKHKGQQQQSKFSRVHKNNIIDTLEDCFIVLDITDYQELSFQIYQTKQNKINMIKDTKVGEFTILLNQLSHQQKANRFICNSEYYTVNVDADISRVGVKIIIINTEEPQAKEFAIQLQQNPNLNVNKFSDIQQQFNLKQSTLDYLTKLVGSYETALITNSICNHLNKQNFRIQEYAYELMDHLYKVSEQGYIPIEQFDEIVTQYSISNFTDKSTQLFNKTNQLDKYGQKYLNYADCMVFLSKIHMPMDIPISNPQFGIEIIAAHNLHLLNQNKAPNAMIELLENNERFKTQVVIRESNPNFGYCIYPPLIPNKNMEFRILNSGAERELLGSAYVNSSEFFQRFRKQDKSEVKVYIQGSRAQAYLLLRVQSLMWQADKLQETRAVLQEIQQYEIPDDLERIRQVLNWNQ